MFYRQLELPFVLAPRCQGEGFAQPCVIDSSTALCAELTAELMSAEEAVREQLRDALLDRAAPPVGAVFEFWIPLSNERVDVALIGSEMAAFEIKTARDTLKRLHRQAEAYGRVFDRCTSVVDERHLAGVAEILPTWWGITAILRQNQTHAFHCIRPPEANPEIDPETLVRLLWRNEARLALSLLGVETDPRESRSGLWQRLLALVSIDRLRELVRVALLQRDVSLARIPTRRFQPSS